MREVFLNVYDVTTSESERTNTTISTLNGITHTLGLGGVFHGAVEVCGEEWSFGFCDEGTGVYSCPPRRNPLYTFRESVSLGVTRQSPEEIARTLRHMKEEWLGNSYELLTRNCCNFCEDFALRLGTDPVPAWLNRFATGMESALVVTDKFLKGMGNLTSTIQQGSQESMLKVRQAFQGFLDPDRTSKPSF